MSKKRLWIFSIVWISFVSTLYAQDDKWIKKLNPEYQQLSEEIQTHPDATLQQLLTNTPSKSANRLEVAQYHLVLSDVYNTLVFPKEAVKHAQMGLSYVSKSQQPWLFYKLQLKLSIAYDSNGTPAKGLKKAQDALKWADINKDVELKIDALMVNGYIQISLSDYILALETLQKAYKLAQESRLVNPATVASVIALVYEYRGEAELSIPYFQQAVNYHRKNDNWIELSIALYGLGRAHGIVGQTDLAIKELQESADISLEIKDQQGAAYAWKELAGIAMQKKQYTHAKSLIQKSLEIFKKADNKMVLFDMHMILSRLAVILNKPKEAQYYNDEAIKFINKEKHPLHYISYLKQQTKISALKGDYENAYKNLWHVMKKETAQLAKQSTKQLHQIRSKYEIENKDKQNKILTQENELNQINLQKQVQKNKKLTLKLIAAMTAITLLIFFAYWYRRNKLFYEKIASIDGLTNVLTRSKSIELLKNSFSQLNTKEAFSLAMIDLDHFKRINDNYGHQVGDSVLKEVGKICIYSLPEKCIIGRFGGEEFIIGIKDINKKQTFDIIENLRLEIMKIPEKLGVNSLSVSISVGLCHFNLHKNLDDMIKCADDALYQAKSNGRNQLVEQLY